MMHSITRPFAAAALAVLATAACGGAQTGTPAPAPHTHGTQSAELSPTRWNGGRAWTQADIDFMTHMIGHHAQAIEMSRLAPTHGARNSVRILAGRIISAQEDEIATMQSWLRDRGLPVPDAHAHHGHGELMPGMLTPEQLAQLDAARGEEFDRLFLTYMIQHHQGAVHMVERLFGSYGAGQDETVFKFASDVNVDQATEIARMQLMLQEVVFGSTTP